MNVLIVGATGPTGRLAIERATALGHQVTALARRPEALAGVSGVRVVKGGKFEKRKTKTIRHD